MSKESLIKVAAIQFEPLIGQKEKNVNKMVKLAEKAADQGAKLIVLPEMANTGRDEKDVRLVLDEIWKEPPKAQEVLAETLNKVCSSLRRLWSTRFSKIIIFIIDALHI